MTTVARAEALFREARAGERRALGRLITLVERDQECCEAAAVLADRSAGGGHVVGMTGAPGAGKSTLTGELVASFAEAGRRPAVLAIDPSSPLTGGAILGDRIRMNAEAYGAFVRSMATRGHRGGLSQAVPGVVRVLDAMGFDPIIVETVGVGQSEVDIAPSTDTTLLVVAPGWGDAIQANKAGLAEVADVLVVNKADRWGAEDARRDLEHMLDMGSVSGHEARTGRRPPVLLTTATTGEGVAELAVAVDAHREHLVTSGELDRRRGRRRAHEVRENLERLLTGRAAEFLETAEGRDALDETERGETSPATVAQRIADRLAPPP